MTKGLLLYNPKSGDQSIKNKLDYIFERFQDSGILLVPLRLFQNDQTTEHILEALKSGGFSFILLLGGDGSLNYAANLLLKYNISIPMGVYPGGTCNDFARSIGMPDDLDNWISGILSGKTKYVDAGCINDSRYFLCNVGGGMFAGASFQTGNELKKNLGPVAYYLKALDELSEIKVFDLTVDTESCHVEEKVILFLVLNGRNVAGFSNFLKEADIEDGFIDILLFKEGRPMELIGLFIKMLAKEITEDRHIIHLRAKEALIRSDQEIQITVDGEKGTCLPVKVRCIPHGLRLFVNAP